MKSKVDNENGERICVVIPTYNESKNIVSLINKIMSIFRMHNIDGFVVIVDDNSPDGTGKLVEEFSKNNSRVYVICRNSKMGLGSAYKDGFNFAVDKLKSKILIQMDADFSHNPEYIPSFLKKIEEGFDVVVGSRNIDGGGIVGWGLKRRFLSFTANKLAKILCGLTISDVTSGFKVFTSNVFRKISSKICSNGFDFQVETLFWVQKEGFKVAELPIIFVNRKDGKSKLTIEEILRFIFTCIILSVKRFQVKG